MLRAAGIRSGPGGSLRRGPGGRHYRQLLAERTATATSPPPARPLPATWSATIRTGGLPGAHRLADDRHRPGPAHADHGPDLKVVFVGPCIAKKVEARARRRARRDVEPCSPFPSCGHVAGRARTSWSGVGPAISIRRTGPPAALFPISRGILQAADIREDLMTGEVVATQGRTHVLEASRSSPTATGRQAAGGAVLRGLHHGAGDDQRPAAVQPPRPGAPLRLPPHRAAGPGRVAASTWTASPTWT